MAGFRRGFLWDVALAASGGTSCRARADWIHCCGVVPSKFPQDSFHLLLYAGKTHFHIAAILYVVRGVRAASAGAGGCKPGRDSHGLRSRGGFAAMADGMAGIAARFVGGNTRIRGRSGAGGDGSGIESGRDLSGLEHRMLTHGGSERSRDGYGAYLSTACYAWRLGTEPRRLRSGTRAPHAHAWRLGTELSGGRRYLTTRASALVDRE